MILYSNDWIKYQTQPHVHYETPNSSFTEMAAKYYGMNVKNCLFHLSLFNRSLIGVDPHSPNLTTEQKTAIAAECAINFWYFIREVIRIPVKGVEGGISYIANRGNLALSWLYLCHIDTFLIQPRQTGKSVSTDCLMMWLIYFGSSNNSYSLITKGDLRAENIKRIKGMRDMLPAYLIHRDKKDPDNSEWIGYLNLKNVYKAAIAQGNETAANNLGRGITTATIHIDEGPFLSFIDVTVPAALNATTNARRYAEMNGTPHGNIFTTTAGRRDSREGKYFYGILQKAAVWSEIYLDCVDFKELSELIMNNSGSAAPAINITMSHRQLGYTDEWLRKVIAQNQNTKDSAERDYLNRWTSGNLTSPLSIALNEKVTSSMREVVWEEVTKQKYIIRWYISKRDIEDNRGKTHYVIGMDTSDATTTGDGITVVIRDIRDMGVVGVMNFRNTNLVPVSQMVAELLITHTNSTLVIERNRAQNLIDHLLIELPKRGIDPFKRIYNTLTNDQTVRRTEYQEVATTPLGQRTQEFYDSKRTCFGFWTGAQTRSLLYGTVLQESAKQTGWLVRDAELISQITGLVAKNSRVDHKSNSHDDLVVAWLLTYWFITDARHHDCYGINVGQVMSVKERTQVFSVQEEAWIEQQERYRAELSDIMDQLKSTTNPMLLSRLEKKLVFVKSKIVATDEAAVTVDQLLQEAKEARSLRARTDRVNNSPLRRQMGYKPPSARRTFAGAGFF